MKRLAAAIGLAAAAACGAASQPVLVAKETSVVSAIHFDAAMEGVAPGFDLDGVDSPEGDRATCGHADFADPAGARGVDNQFATIFSLVDAVAPGAVASLVQQNIDDGLMLLIVDLESYDDGHREVVLRSTTGDPLLGTDGRLLDHQTFDARSAVLLGRTGDVRELADGTLEAGPFDVRLELTIFDYLYRFTFEGGRARFRPGQGLIGGAVPVPELLTALAQASAAAEADYTSLFTGLIEDTADMKVSAGKCSALSAAFALDLVPAFTFGE